MKKILNLMLLSIVLGCNAQLKEVKKEKNDSNLNFSKSLNMKEYPSFNPFEIDAENIEISGLNSYVGIERKDHDIFLFPMITGTFMDTIKLNKTSNDEYSSIRIIEDEASYIKTITYFKKDLIIQIREYRESDDNRLTTIDVVHFYKDHYVKFVTKPEFNSKSSDFDFANASLLKKESFSVEYTNVELVDNVIKQNSRTESKSELGTYESKSELTFEELGLDKNNISSTEDAIFWSYLVLDLW